MVLMEKVGEICIRNVDRILAAVYMGRNEHIEPCTCIELLRDLIFQSEFDSGTRTEAPSIAELVTLSTESLLGYIIVELGQGGQSKREKARNVIDVIEGYACTRQGQRRECGGIGAVQKTSIHILLRLNEEFSAANKGLSMRMKAKYLRCLVPLVKVLDPIQCSILLEVSLGFPRYVAMLNILLSATD